jgi:hypothetical protein
MIPSVSAIESNISVSVTTLYNAPTAESHEIQRGLASGED